MTAHVKLSVWVKLKKMDRELISQSESPRFALKWRPKRTTEGHEIRQRIESEKALMAS